MDVPAIAAIIEKMEAEMAGNGRILVRPSGTEPLLRVMAEAPTDDEVNYYVDTIADVVRAENWFGLSMLAKLRGFMATEVFKYLFFGVLATLVYMVSRTLIFQLTKQGTLSAVLANAIAIIFAFFYK